jgi:hypothetical protein
MIISSGGPDELEAGGSQSVKAFSSPIESPCWLPTSERSMQQDWLLCGNLIASTGHENSGLVRCYSSRVNPHKCANGDYQAHLDRVRSLE